MLFLKLTTVVIVFWDMHTFYPIFLPQQEKRDTIITNKNGKYKLTGELPNDVRLKKLAKLHGVIV